MVSQPNTAEIWNMCGKAFKALLEVLYHLTEGGLICPVAMETLWWKD